MLKIITLGNELLRKPSATIADFDKGLETFAQAMLETMYRGNGIGLAGPQVGELKRIFVMHVAGDKPRIFVNPEILQTSIELVSYEEGCLSIPGAYADLTRPEKITIQAWNEQGKPFTLDAEGFLARVIQHEMDHLKGVLFIDHLEEKRRKRLLNTYSPQELLYK